MLSKVLKNLIVVVLLMFGLIPMAFAEDVEVVLPYFDIQLNEATIDNETEMYPFIQYKGITYIPMTWDFCQALGLKTKWDPTTGLEILKSDHAVFYEQKEFSKNTIGSTYQAALVDFPVKINGRLIDNAAEAYPILKFKNVTYFPMTYHYMVNEFNSGYHWDESMGLFVSADETLEMKLPEPLKVEYKYELDSVEKGQLLVEDLWKWDLENEIIRISYSHPEYNGMILDVEVDYTDKYGRYWLTEKLLSGIEYDSFDDGKLSYGTHHLMRFDKMSDSAMMTIKFIFKSKALVAYETDQILKAENVEFKMVHSDEINKEYLSQYGHYMIPKPNQMERMKNVPSDETIKYVGVRQISHGRMGTEPKDLELVYFNDDLRMNPVEPGKSAFLINKYTEYKVDTLKFYSFLNGYVDDRLVDEFSVDFIYVYDENRQLTTIIAIKDAIIKNTKPFE